MRTRRRWSRRRWTRRRRIRRRWSRRRGGRSHEGGADTFPSPTWANWVEGIPALHNLATIFPQKEQSAGKLFWTIKNLVVIKLNFRLSCCTPNTHWFTMLINFINKAKSWKSVEAARQTSHCAFWPMSVNTCDLRLWRSLCKFVSCFKKTTFQSWFEKKGGRLKFNNQNYDPGPVK